MGVNFGVFAENFSRIVVPRAARLGISAATAAQRCSVQGQFVDERSTIAYCIAYAWMHYASFKDAIGVLRVEPRELPHRPLIVDVGCGPGTALVAFGELLREARGAVSDIRYIGIDRSVQMRALAASFATDTTLFENYEPLLLGRVGDLTSETVEAQSRGRDGVVFTMSYVLHQDFMLDGQAFNHIIRCLSSSRLDIWLLAQDANMTRRDEANVDRWPDARLRAMLNGIEAFGYGSRVWSKTFEAKQYVLDEQGNATEQPAQGRRRTMAVAARLYRT